MELLLAKDPLAIQPVRAEPPVRARGTVQSEPPGSARSDTKEGSSLTGFEKAKDLFFRYEGSVFYMSRDGVERQYLAIGIPQAVEEEWLVELTELHLNKLTERGNWWSILFFIDHRDYRHMETIAAAGPRGDFRQKCNYLGLLLDYIEKSENSYAADRRIEVCNQILSHIAALRRRIRADRSIDRLDALEKRTKEFLEAIRR